MTGARSSQLMIVVIVLVGSALAEKFQHFSFFETLGVYPEGGLVVDGAGNFYGSTFSGGTAGQGVIYEINRTFEATLYSFTGANGDGSNPIGDLILDSTGNLYGVTEGGGNQGGLCIFPGCGTVFELSPPQMPGEAWTETVIHTFQGVYSDDGAYPEAGLLFDAAGNLYGTATAGGQFGHGVVFELMPPPQPGGIWTESILYSFEGSPEDGATPHAQLIFDQVGNLYGTTQLGGMDNLGTIFELSPPSAVGGAWTESILHDFRYEVGYPLAGLTFGPGGALFGTVTDGGGTVFRLTPPSGQGDWNYEPIAMGEVYKPEARVIFNGPDTLFGTDAGQVFEISFSGGRETFTRLYTPISSMGGVVLYNGALYGTSIADGTYHDGSIFRLSP